MNDNCKEVIIVAIKTIGEIAIACINKYFDNKSD